MARSGKKVLVAYRVLPGDADHCLVIATESLDADQHDSLIKLVESNTGQSAYELADAMARVTLPDGRNMLGGLHMYGKLTKVSTKDVDMIPDTQTTINLAELNKIIAEQKGVTVEDLAVQPPNAPKKQEQVVLTEETIVNDPIVNNVKVEPLSDEQLAAQYRSQADAMYKEAKRLREQAEELAPTKRKTKSSVTES